DDGLPRGATVRATWTVLSGPGVVRFDDPHAAATTAHFDREGQYVLRLTADDSILVGSDDVVLDVSGNLAPVVDAGPDQTLRYPTLTAQLHGAASDDGLPGSTLHNSWSLVSGPGPVAFADAAASDTAVTLSGPGD